MPPFDRDGALRKAEKALRQGRIDAAIEEYIKIVDAQPRDWNSANALGDLYVRAGQTEKGVAQFSRIAEHLATEGFYPKAAALYKKIIKVKPDDEPSLLQLGEIAAKQGLLADAKNAFRVVAENRRARGDRRGAAEISVRVGTLDPEDLEARLGAARAAADIDDHATALREFREVAFKFDKQGRPEKALVVFQLAFDLNPQDPEIKKRLLQGYLATGDLAKATQVADSTEDLKQLAAALKAANRTEELLDVLAQIADRDPADREVRSRLAQAYVAKGDLARARAYLTRETAGTDPALWLTLAGIELSSGLHDEGSAAVAEALKLDPAVREAAIALGCRLVEQSPDAAYACIDAIVNAALADNHYQAAAAALQPFVTQVPSHVVALMRLVDICVDGGLETAMYDAQAQLADAYLGVGRALEARIISEDLVGHDPLNRANLDRFRRALVMLGEDDPDAIIAERVSGDSPFLGGELDLNEGITFDEPDSEAPIEITGDEDETVIDLSLVAEAPSPEEGPQAPAPRSLDQVFKQMRDEVGRGSAEEVAAEQYRLALTYRDLGMAEEAVKALEEAARSPRQRFDACSLLGQMYLERGEQARAVDWFERAAEAPAPTVDAGRALLYDLAQTLETVGESARALAVFVELESESGGYRDVAGRIDRLSKVQAKG